MVVANSNNRTRLAVNAADYDFTFRITADSEIKVYLVNVVDGEDVLTLQTLTTNYTVTIDTVNEGGTVSFQESDGVGGYTPVTPDCDEVLMVRNMSFTQDADIPVRGGFRETVIELALDKLEMQIQQLKDAIDYSADSDPVSVASAAASATAAAASELAAEAAQAAAEVAQAAAEVAQAAAEASGVAAVNDALDTVTGHHHDGSDSKKISVSDLDGTILTLSQFLTAGSSWVCPSGITRVFVTLQGAGGAGGGGTGTVNAGGGGSGALRRRIPHTVVPLSSYAYSVGAGGIGQYWADGPAGGDTTFDTLSAGGGGGGTGATGGVAGASGTGAPSVPTAGGLRIEGGVAGATTSGSYGGGGAGSYFGTGGLGGTQNLQSAAVNGGHATGYGAGGGGGSPYGDAGVTGSTGGNGSPGFILLEY